MSAKITRARETTASTLTTAASQPRKTIKPLSTTEAAKTGQSGGTSTNRETRDSEDATKFTETGETAKTAETAETAKTLEVVKTREPVRITETALITEIAEGIYRFSIPIPLEYSPVNVYFLAGKVPTLIDAAFAVPDAWASLKNSLSRLGYDVSDIKQILLTHGHVDHLGLASRIYEKSGAAVIMHPLEWVGVQAFQNPSAELDEMIKNRFNFWGIPEETQDMIAGFRHKLRVISMVPEAAVKTIEDGETIQAGDDQLFAIHCPGHTPGQMVWHLPEKNLAFTGDHVLKAISPNPDLYLPPQHGSWSGLPHYLASLEKVSALDGTVCFPGHGEEITELGERIAQIQKGHEERKERIAELFAGESLDLNTLTHRFLADIGRKPDGPTFFLGLRETLGHLYLLDAEGRLKMETIDGVLHYSVLA